MKKYVKLVLRVINFLVMVFVTYAVLSPEGTWMPRNPNWSDLLTMIVIAFTFAWIDHRLDNKPKDPNPPKNGKYA